MQMVTGRFILGSLEQNRELFKQMLLKWNTHINLVSRQNPEKVFDELWEKAMEIENGLPEELTRILDIGSGNGFPAIPIKLMRMHVDIKLLEPRKKRYNFLLYARTELSLYEGFNIYNVRWQEFTLPDYWLPEKILHQGIKLGEDFRRKFNLQSS